MCVLICVCHIVTEILTTYLCYHFPLSVTEIDFFRLQPLSEQSIKSSVFRTETI